MIHLLLLIIICIIHIIISYNFKNNSKMRRIEIYTISFFIFLFSALRSKNVGIDLPDYCKYYEYISMLNFNEILHLSYRDVGWPFFLGVLTRITNNPQFLIIVTSAWTTFTFAYLVDHLEGNVLMIFIFYICLRIFPFTLTGIRQAMAMGFIYIAFVKLINKKNLTYFILIFLASLFHTTSIIFLISFILVKIKNNLFIFVTTMLLGVTELVTRNSITKFVTNTFFPRFNNYIENAIGQEVSIGATFIIILLLLLFCSIFIKKIEKKDHIASFYYRLSCVGVMFFMIGQGFDNMFRMSYYFICFLFPLFSLIENKIFDKKTTSVFNFLIILSLISQYIYLGPGAGINNYEFYWNTLSIL